MSGCTVRSGAVVQYAILDENVTVESGAMVGETPIGEPAIAVVGNGVTVKTGESVKAGEMLNKAQYESRMGGARK